MIEIKCQTSTFNNFASNYRAWYIYTCMVWKSWAPILVKFVFNITYAWWVIQVTGGKILANLATRLDWQKQYIYVKVNTVNVEFD